MPDGLPNLTSSLRLAGRWINIADLPYLWQNPPCKVDPEVVSASHRFHWALEWLAAGLDGEGARLISNAIADWLENYGEPRPGISWEPYTVSERICNWIAVLPALQRTGAVSLEFSQGIFEALALHARYLSANLEYPAGGQINNHILNNARALYQVGALLGLNVVQGLGRVLFERHLPTMISPSGYLGEASSHYHLLLTRTVLECAAVARYAQDDTFAVVLEQVGQRMLAAASQLFPPQLASPHDGPKIGDVSPDIPFDWFMPATGCAWRKVWHTPVRQVVKNSKSSIDSGWLVVDSERWMLRAFVHPARDLYPVGHGHPDFGSFWLAWRGHALVVDMGRLTYMAPDGNSSGVEAESHGVVLLDGMPLLRHGRGWRGTIAGEAMKRTSCEFFAGGKGVRWKAIGEDGVCWQRTIEIDDEQVVLTDCIRGAVRYRMVSGSLLLGPNVVVNPVSNGNWMFRSGGTIRAESESMCEWSVTNAPFYPEYGVTTSVPSLIWQCAAKDDIEVKLILTPQAEP